MMTKFFNGLFGGLLIISLGCSKTNVTQQNQEFLLEVENGPQITAEEFLLYDSSTQILYFNRLQAGLSEHVDKKVNFTVNDEVVWEGYLRSTLVEGHTENTAWLDPTVQQKYFVFLDSPVRGTDPKLLEAFKRQQLLHQGIKVELLSIEYQTNQVIANFSITNEDKENVLVFDVEKMGLPLFHYFTSGLELWSEHAVNILQPNIKISSPQPWDGWSPQWLSTLKSGEKKTFHISYPLQSKIPAGDYTAQFTFPGLDFQVSPHELWQAQGRIWLGQVSTSKKVRIS